MQWDGIHSFDELKVVCYHYFVFFISFNDISLGIINHDNTLAKVIILLVLFFDEASGTRIVSEPCCVCVNFLLLYLPNDAFQMNMFIMRCIVGCRALSFSSFAHHNRQPQHQQKLLLSADSTWFASPNIINSCETFHMLIVIKQHELQTNKIIIIHFSVWNTYLAGGESNSLRDMVNVDLKLNRPYQRANGYLRKNRLTFERAVF